MNMNLRAERQKGDLVLRWQTTLQENLSTEVEAREEFEYFAKVLCLIGPITLYIYIQYQITPTLFYSILILMYHGHVSSATFTVFFFCLMLMLLLRFNRLKDMQYMSVCESSEYWIVIWFLSSVALWFSLGSVLGSINKEKNSNVIIAIIHLYVVERSLKIIHIRL